MKITRQSSIHITEKNLIKVLAIIESKYDVQTNAKLDYLATLIAEEAKGYSLVNRSIHVTNDKLKRDTNKVMMAGRDSTALFVGIIHMLRRQMKHRGLILPKPGNPEWLNYKETTSLAEEFCNEYGFSKKEGFKKYAEIGLSKIQNFSIFKFKNLHEAIFKEYEATTKISNDRNAKYTFQAHQYFTKLVQERIGFCQGYQKDPIKYACFIGAVETAREFGIDPRTYIKAQFAGFDWRSGIPDPLQLTGIKAIERLQTYCFEQGIKIGKENQDKKIDFNKIKNAGK